jgi:hypothetical protein
MGKTFRPWKIDELLLRLLVQNFVAEDHLVRFVVSLVQRRCADQGEKKPFGGVRSIKTAVATIPTATAVKYLIRLIKGGAEGSLDRGRWPATLGPPRLTLMFCRDIGCSTVSRGFAPPGSSRRSRKTRAELNRKLAHGGRPLGASPRVRTSASRGSGQA